MAQRLTTIRAQLAKLQKQAAQLERATSKRIRAAAKVIAKYKLSASDLAEALKLSGGGRASSGPDGRRSPLAGKPVPAKYRDSAGNTWTGRGRPPLWLVAAEKAGKTRESFLIGAQKSAKTGKAKATTSTKTATAKAKKAARPKAKAKSKRPAKTRAAPIPAAEASAA